jgi:hypothetical protein
VRAPDGIFVFTGVPGRKAAIAVEAHGIKIVLTLA